jgi:hypothetical protein
LGSTLLLSGVIENPMIHMSLTSTAIISNIRGGSINHRRENKLANFCMGLVRVVDQNVY